MVCPYCGSENLKKNGIKYNKQQYQCKDCKKYFSSNNVEIKPKEETVKCIYCGGHTNKSGKTKWGVQIYWCRDCHKRFNENTMPQPPIKERCPYCGGELKYKGWSNNGHNRRYICKECGKGFSGDLSNLQVRKIEKPCPYCGSEDVKKGGHLRSGARRYVCNSCGKGYNENTVVEEPKHRPEKCPYCGGTHINCSGHDKNGKQRYKCVECGKKFVENPTQKEFKRWEIECPYCHHVGARKAGVSSGKKQYFQCLECKHKFMEHQHHQHTTPILRANVLKDLELGMTKLDISKKYGVSEKTIGTITKGRELAWRRIQVQETKLKRKLEHLAIQRKKRNFREQNVEDLKNKVVFHYSCYGVSLEENLKREFMDLFNSYLQDKIKKYTLTEQFKLLLEKGHPIMKQKQEEQERRLKRQRKFSMIKEVLKGQPEDMVASKYNVDIKHLQDSLEKYYNMESLTEEQKSNIIKFGVGASVPVEYIAPYIPCSVKKCQEILSKFTVKPRKKYERTEQEKHQDWYDLDKYIMR